jgi:hypothetical protein
MYAVPPGRSSAGHSGNRPVDADVTDERGVTATSPPSRSRRGLPGADEVLGRGRLLGIEDLCRELVVSRILRPAVGRAPSWVTEPPGAAEGSNVSDI